MYKKKYMISKRRGSKDSLIIRVSKDFKELIDEIKREYANLLKVPPEKIPTPLVTDKIAKIIKSKKKQDLNSKVSKLLDQITGIE